MAVNALDAAPQVEELCWIYYTALRPPDRGNKYWEFYLFVA